MGIYDRNEGKPKAKKNLWVSYAITEAQRIRFGRKSRTYREPSPANNERVAKAFLAQRRREVADDTWHPASDGEGRGNITLAKYAAERIAARRAAGVRGIRHEEQRLRDYVLPVLGEKRMLDVRRTDVVQLIDSFAKTPLLKTGKLPAPRMVHLVYADLRILFAHAVKKDEIVPATPCTLEVGPGELPKSRDANPRWRATAVFTRDEVEVLLGDPKIHPLHRMTYGLIFLTGTRIGEAAGLLWRDYDCGLRPLGRIVVATTYGGDKGTKTETPRLVPVHPLLATMLAEWKREFAVHFDRHPTPDDFVVPRLVKRTRGGGRRSEKVFQDFRYVWRYLQRDLKALGIRGRRVHDGRRTFITLARTDGAQKDILDWITHGPDEADMQDLYTSFPWEKLCEQVSCLRITPRSLATVTQLHTANAAQGR